MALFLSIVLLGVWVVIMWMAANKFQAIAESKGHKERYWAWCFWVAPIGYMMVLALPDLTVRQNQHKIIEAISSNQMVAATESVSVSKSVADDFAAELPDL